MPSAIYPPQENTVRSDAKLKSVSGRRPDRGRACYLRVTSASDRDCIKLLKYFLPGSDKIAQSAKKRGPAPMLIENLRENDPVSLVEARLEAHKLIFAPLLFQATRVLRDLGILRA